MCAEYRSDCRGGHKKVVFEAFSDVINRTNKQGAHEINVEGRMQAELTSSNQKAIKLYNRNATLFVMSES